MEAWRALLHLVLAVVAHLVRGAVTLHRGKVAHGAPGVRGGTDLNVPDPVVADAGAVALQLTSLAVQDVVDGVEQWVVATTA